MKNEKIHRKISLDSGEISQKRLRMQVTEIQTDHTLMALDLSSTPEYPIRFYLDIMDQFGDSLALAPGAGVQRHHPGDHRVRCGERALYALRRAGDLEKRESAPHGPARSGDAGCRDVFDYYGPAVHCAAPKSALSKICCAAPWKPGAECPEAGPGGRLAMGDRGGLTACLSLEPERRGEQRASYSPMHVPDVGNFI